MFSSQTFILLPPNIPQLPPNIPQLPTIIPQLLVWCYIVLVTLHLNHLSFFHTAENIESEDLLLVPAGLDSELPEEIPGTFLTLPFVKYPQGHVSCILLFACII